MFASPPTTTTLVGATISASPWPMIQAVIVVARLTWAKSASGASSGIASAPCPELDGISTPSGMLTSVVRPVKNAAEKTKINELAMANAGQAKIDNQLEVKN